MRKKKKSSTDRINWRRFRRLAEAHLSADKVEDLEHDLAELDGACRIFRRRIALLISGLAVAQSDSRRLFKYASEMLGELEHIRDHIRTAQPKLRRLRSKARDMPPLGDVSDLEMTKRALHEHTSKIHATWVKAQERRKNKGK